MKKLDFNLSASTLGKFDGCPWAFQQDKILKREPISKAGATLVKAQAFHELMKAFYYKKDFITRSLFNDWEGVFNQKTKEYKCTDPYLKYTKMSGYTMIKNWVAMAHKNKWLQKAKYLGKDYGIELEFIIPYENDRYEINVKGYIDAIFQVDDKLFIVDWKTGKYYDYYRIQGLIYSWALNKKYGYVEDAVLFVHPAKKVNDIFIQKVEDKDYNEIVVLVNKMFDCIDNNEFEKKPADGCRYCDYVDCEYNKNNILKDHITANNLKIK